jgi:hypothetical protein
MGRMVAVLKRIALTLAIGTALLQNGPVRAQSQISENGYELVPISPYEYAGILPTQAKEELAPVDHLAEEPLGDDLDSLLSLDVDRLSNVNVRDISSQESQSTSQPAL